MSDNETKNPYVEFFQQYKGEIAVAGLTILTVKHRAFRRDFRILADTVSNLTKGLEALVEHGARVNDHVEELYARTDELASWQNDHYAAMKAMDNRMDMLDSLLRSKSKKG